MPPARIDLIKGKPAEYRRTIGEVVYTAMVEILKAPKDDRFQVIAEHDEANFIYDPNFFGVSMAPLTPGTFTLASVNAAARCCCGP